MPRPKSPCGSYSAYQRHLRERAPIDPACRRAQQEHDAGRSGRERPRPARPLPAALPPAAAGDERDAQRERARLMLVKCADDLADFIDTGYLYGVLDLMAEMNELVEQWREAADEHEVMPQ
ncbi:hypothetical protein [Microbacterium aurum]